SSPDRRIVPPAGNVRCLMLCCGFLPGDAALTGLRVHRRPRIGSPDRCAASPPGRCSCSYDMPLKQRDMQRCPGAR
ncbi:hypothetical protein SL621_24925, partial [Escherichia coli]|uniref:hypothetical protein n=1 Tax=Escherichia coli TaxID=562 RepID=UPI0038622F3F